MVYVYTKCSSSTHCTPEFCYYYSLIFTITLEKQKLYLINFWDIKNGSKQLILYPIFSVCFTKMFLLLEPRADALFISPQLRKCEEIFKKIYRIGCFFFDIQF